MGVFGTHYDMNTFPLAEGSFYPRFLCLRKKQQQQRRVLISLVMELCQKNLGRQAEVNPDKNCACEGVLHLQNKAVYCASRIKKGCVGERSVWGLLQIFLQAVVAEGLKTRFIYKGIWIFFFFCQMLFSNPPHCTVPPALLKLEHAHLPTC